MDLNGELTVIGGHTTGYIPTATAEYLKDGHWHTVQSLYPHDYAIAAALPDGKVLVAGGMSEPFGKGRSLGAELYDPASHSFSPLPIIDRARTRGSATVLSDGTIVVSGNWYGEDNIAIYSLGLWLMLKKKPSGEPSQPEFDYPVPSQGADLASRIANLVEQKQLFRRKGLKVQDIATELGTNSTYISACTNGQWGMSFPEYLSNLRIRYSQELMGEHPDMPLHRVADEAGFSSEQSFFRSFKAATGKTPSEWREQHG